MSNVRYQVREVGVWDAKVGALVTVMSGEAWEEYHAWLAAGGVPDPAPGPGDVPLEEALARKLSEINERALIERRRITGPVSAQEMSSWTLKRAEALAYDPKVGDSTAPMLALEAAARGVATVDIVARVRANAQGYSQAEAAIAGVSGRHRDAVRALADSAAIADYDISAGWPSSPPKDTAPVGPA